jgi:hypothetical protein
MWYGQTINVEGKQKPNNGRTLCAFPIAAETPVYSAAYVKNVLILK